MRGRRVIHGGRKEVRCALDMAALALSRRASRFASRLPGPARQGQAQELALVAIMRKLLATLNAIAKTQKPMARAAARRGSVNLNTTMVAERPEWISCSAAPRTLLLCSSSGMARPAPARRGTRTAAPSLG